VKSTNPLITEFSRCIPVAYPEAGDSELQISSEISPTVDLIYPVDRYQNPPNNVPQTTSKVSYFSFSLTNTGGFTTPVVELAKGLWRITITISIGANYSNLGGGTCVGVSLAYPLIVGNSNIIAGVVAAGAAGAEQVSETTQTMDFLIPADGARLGIAYQANGVAENFHGFVMIYSARLV
jgi:hypothetical protein